MSRPFILALLILCESFSTSSGQTAMTAADSERFSELMKADALASLKDARESARAQLDFLQWMLDYLQSKSLQNQVDEKLIKLFPQVRAALGKTPSDCALVSIIVDRPILENDGTLAPLLRSVTFEGIGDTGAKVVARNILSTEKTGGYRAAPPPGYAYDEKSSHMICFVMDGGTIKAKEIYMPLFRSSIEEAVKDLKKAEADAKAKADAQAKAELEKKVVGVWRTKGRDNKYDYPFWLDLKPGGGGTAGNGTWKAPLTWNLNGDALAVEFKHPDRTVGLSGTINGNVFKAKNRPQPGWGSLPYTFVR
jgi:hypothetical protein